VTDWGGFWIAVALLIVAFGPSNCEGPQKANDSIAVAIVKHLEAK
jgi:hypothetical protein